MSELKQLIDVLNQKADNAYCDYLQQMRRPECLGWAQKIKEGIFGDREMTAHTHAGELLGRHRAFAEAIRLLRSEDR